MTDPIHQMILEVRSGKSASAALAEGLVRRKNLILSKSKSSFQAGDRTATRRMTTSRDSGWTYQIPTDGSDEVIVSEIMKAVLNKGELEVFTSDSRYPIAHIVLSEEGWQFTILDPQDAPRGLPFDPEIRAAQRKMTTNPSSRSQARHFVELIVSKVKGSSFLGSGLTVA